MQCDRVLKQAVGDVAVLLCHEPLYRNARVDNDGERHSRPSRISSRVSGNATPFVRARIARDTATRSCGVKGLLASSRFRSSCSSEIPLIFAYAL